MQIYRGLIEANHLTSLIRFFGIPSHADIRSRFAKEASRSGFPLQFALYHDSFRYGMRIPFPPEVIVILNLLWVNPSQLRPNRDI